MDAHRAWRQRADELSETLKLCMLFGAYADKCHGKRFYGKAVNLSRSLRAAHDAALETYDVLLMPTVPMTARPLPGPDAPREEIVQRAFKMLPNTVPFDISHHPAISLPCGMVDGLPVGLQLVGRFRDEATLYRVADAFETATDWKTL